MSSISSSSPSASTSSQSNGRDELLEQNLLEKEDQFDSVDVGDYDPKIKQHLEELNRFATKINQLEQCYEVIHLDFLRPFVCNTFSDPKGRECQVSENIKRKLGSFEQTDEEMWRAKCHRSSSLL